MKVPNYLGLISVVVGLILRPAWRLGLQCALMDITRHRRITVPRMATTVRNGFRAAYSSARALGFMARNTSTGMWIMPSMSGAVIRVRCRNAARHR